MEDLAFTSSDPQVSAQLNQARENERVNKELQLHVQELEMQILAELKDIGGDNKDEISLLNEITGKFFQGIPQYTHL